MPKKSEEKNEVREEEVSEEPSSTVFYNPVTLVFPNANVGNASEIMNVYGLSLRRHHLEVNSFLTDKKYAEPKKLTPAAITKLLQNKSRISRVSLYEHFGGKAEGGAVENGEDEEVEVKKTTKKKSSKKEEEVAEEEGTKKKGKKTEKKKEIEFSLDNIDTDNDEAYKNMCDFIFEFQKRIASDYGRRDYAPHFNYIRQFDEDGYQMMIVSREPVMAFTDDNPLTPTILEELTKTSKKGKKVSIYGADFPKDDQTQPWIILSKCLFFTQEQAMSVYKKEGKVSYDTTPRAFELVGDDDEPDFDGDINIIVNDCKNVRNLFNYPY